MPFNNIKVIEIGETENITETIEKSLNFIDTKWCLINPITTIPNSENLNKPFIEFGSRILPKENWASVSFSKNNEPLFFSKLDISSNGLNSYPFTGRVLAKTEDINLIISNLKASEKNDLIYLAKNLFYLSKVDISYADWLDIGHLATYPSTRISSISSRFFNNLIYDKNKNIIRKKSINKNKINNEIVFYKSIPDEIKRYFPMIFNIDNQKEYLSYEMEYICKPNLSEIFLFGEIGPNAIFRIINSIERVFKTFYDKESYPKEKADWLFSQKSNLRKLNIEKVLFKKEFRFFKEIYNNDFKLNNHIFPSIKNTFNLVIEELKSFEILRPLHLGHGDLCFNNILVDPIYGSINLIDPKAEKHKTLDIYGLVDNFYDLSKLNHSIEGLYDSVVNDLFRLEAIDNKNITFEVYKPKEYELYNNYFREIISDKRIDYRILRLLTANLFLSMLPMHIDDNNRIVALALIGSIFMSEYSMEKIIL